MSASAAPSARRMRRDQIQAMFAEFARLNPEPKTELNYRNPFELLIAVLLSAQATDISVNKATEALFQHAPDARSMLALGEEGVRDYIKSIGLFRTKAKHVIQTCAQLCQLHHGEVPTSREALEALPGVGRKTANVVLNTAFGLSTMAVDTHLFRLANRMGLAPGKDVLEVEQGLLKRIPAMYLRHAHHWLILHGRYICKARAPLCERCPVIAHCGWRGKPILNSA